MRNKRLNRIGRGFRLAALFCCFCLTGYSAFRALEGTGPLGTAAVARESVATPDRVRSYAPVTQLIPIEQRLVGQRVRSDNPAAGVDLQFGADIIPSEWRKLTLRAPKRDGTVADVVLLRPLTWLNKQRGEVGGTVFISVPECGIDGNAEVLEIDPCPEILPGEGRVITGTFRHQVSASISLSIAGQAEPILCTGNHPFWSEDRQDFVRADSLQPNETLRTATGTTTVTSFCHIPGSTPVYNLEIHGTHVYHVGTSGVLVHNGDPCPDAEALFNPLLRTKTLVTVLEPGQTIYGFVTRKGEVLAQAVVKGKAGHEQMANQLAVSGLLAKIKSGEIIPFTVSKHSQTGQMAIFGSGYFGNWNMSQWQKELIGKLFK